MESSIRTEDMTVGELMVLANQAEDMAHGLMQKAMDLRVQARNKQVDIIKNMLAEGANK
jgi:predicted transcriptional regulator